MPQLIPIQLDDNTIIYIEATNDATVPNMPIPSHGDEEESPTKKGGLVVPSPQSIQAIKGTIRAYTIQVLKAFEDLAEAQISKVTLTFGLEVGGEMGIPYITKGQAKSNLNIQVECSFPAKLGDITSIKPTTNT